MALSCTSAPVMILWSSGRTVVSVERAPHASSRGSSNQDQQEIALRSESRSVACRLSVRALPAFRSSSSL